MSTKKLQILGSLGEKIYKQNEEPVDAEIGAIWIDLDESYTNVIREELPTTEGVEF